MIYSDMNGDTGGTATADGRLRFWWGLLLRIGLTALAVYVLWRVRAIVSTVIIAAVIATAAGALVDPLCRIRIKGLSPRPQRTIATALVYAFLLFVVIWSVQLLITPFQQEWRNLQERWPGYQATLTQQFASLRDQYADLPIGFRQFVEAQRGKAEMPSPGEWGTRLLGGAVAWTSHIIELILIPVLAFYFTLDTRTLRSEIRFFTPRNRLRPTLAIFRECARIMRDYIVAQFWLAAIAGVLVGGGLAIIGMPYAVILGLFAGITRAIPVVGPLLGGIPVCLLSFIYGNQTNQPGLWILVTLAFTALHLVESKFIMPKFLGHRLHLHAVVIILALLVGGEFFGPIGMFLAAPFAALARVLLTHFIVLPNRRLLAARAQTVSGASGNGATRVLRLERALRGNHGAAQVFGIKGQSASSAPAPPQSALRSGVLDAASKSASPVARD